MKTVEVECKIHGKRKRKYHVFIAGHAVSTEYYSILSGNMRPQKYFLHLLLILSLTLEVTKLSNTC